MSVRLIAVVALIALLAVAQADPGWGGRAGVPVASWPVARGLAPLTAIAQDDNENGNDNSDDDDDDTDNDNSDDGGDDEDNDDGGDDEDNDDGDEDNDDGDDDDDDNGNNADDDDDDNDNEGNENDDGDDDNGNDNEDDLDNDNGDDDADVISVPQARPIAIATIPPPAPRYAPAPRPEPVVVEEPYLTEASVASAGGDAEVRLGAGKVVIRLFSSLERGITVTARFADPATLAPIPGGPAGDLVFVVEAHGPNGAPLASLPAEVNLNVSYDDGDVAGLNEEGLVISRLDPSTSSWRPAPRLIRDTVTNFLAASVTELGAYAVHAP